MIQLQHAPRFCLISLILAAPSLHAFSQDAAISAFDWKVEVESKTYDKPHELARGALVQHVWHANQSPASMNLKVTAIDSTSGAHELDRVSFSPFYLKAPISGQCLNPNWTDTEVLADIRDALLPHDKKSDYLVYFGVGNLTDSRGTTAHSHLIITFPVWCTDKKVAHMAMVITDPEALFAPKAEGKASRKPRTHNGLIHGPKP